MYGETFYGRHTAQHQLHLNVIYFTLSGEVNAYQMKIKLIFSTVKRYRIISLVSDTIYIFSL